MVRHLRSLGRPAAVPFAGALAGVVFGTLYGLTRFSVPDVMRGAVNWLVPILFGFFLYQERQRYERYKSAIVRSLVWGTLVMGVYGIVQFFLLPGWDEAWMVGLNDGAFGEPVARQLRVFSTMNSPVTVAFYLAGGLLVVFTLLVGWRRGSRMIPMLAAPVGLLALSLTTSRSLWLGLACGVLYLVAAIPGHGRVRVAGAVMAVMLLAGVASQLPGVEDVLAARLKTFESGSSDVSYAARVEGHEEALAKLSSEPLGEGMGSTDAEHATDGSDDRIGPHDSTVLESLYSLGGPGTLIYGLGILAGLVRIFVTGRRAEPLGEPFGWALRAILLGFFAQCLFTSILIGIPGFLLWCCLGMGVAATDPVCVETAPRLPRRMAAAAG